MPTYKTPNVYVEEISKLPPSVVSVSSAVPVFIGYTEKAGEGLSLKNKPTRITNLLEYEAFFGGPETVELIANVRPDGSVKTAEPVNPLTHVMHPSLDIFFKNGGGPCYIISIGTYKDTMDKAHFEDALTKLQKEDEPTIIVLVDAIHLNPTDATPYYDLCQQAIAQCAKLKDRFLVIDVLPQEEEGKDPIIKSAEVLRSKIGTSNLKYAAAYYPYLETSLVYAYQETGVTIKHDYGVWDSDTNGLRVLANEMGQTIETTANPGSITFAYTAGGAEDGGDAAGGKLTINLGEGDVTPSQVLSAWESCSDVSLKKSFSLFINGDGSAAIKGGGACEAPADQNLGDPTLATDDSQLYNSVKLGLTTQYMTLAPSAAIAGVYCRVDAERGVWKAPANVSLASVVKPTELITNLDQEDLNVHTSGKSINAIRFFTDKGVLVWGARTLAGNDNEWRYVPVRRLFNLIEESIQKATQFAVFEPNDVNTWMTVKIMIENYLLTLYQQGAFSGSTPEEAYFVKVGLGETMDSQDILEGRLKFEIGVCAVRPAEFVILQFSHKVQGAAA